MFYVYVVYKIDIESGVFDCKIGLDCILVGELFQFMFLTAPFF